LSEKTARSDKKTVRQNEITVQFSTVSAAFDPKRSRGWNKKGRTVREAMAQSVSIVHRKAQCQVFNIRGGRSFKGCALVGRSWVLPAGGRLGIHLPATKAQLILQLFGRQGLIGLLVALYLFARGPFVAYVHDDGRCG
jgi:hypothetical protein